MIVKKNMNPNDGYDDNYKDDGDDDDYDAYGIEGSELRPGDIMGDKTPF